MKRTLIWDLPTRVFHWLFATGLAIAAGLALGMDEHDPWFAFHALAGLMLAALVVLRIIWGLVGTRHARFGSMAFGPMTVAGYTWKAIAGGKRATPRFAGHNPGTVYVMALMFATLGVLVVTGVMMGMGTKGVKEVHELCAYAMLGLVAAHLAGVLVHTIRHRENIAGAMIHGRKLVEGENGIRSSQPLAAVALIVIMATLGITLLRGYDVATRTAVVPVLGINLQLGEAEHEEHDRGHER